MKYLSIAQTAERWGISTHGLGDSRGRREAGGRENQERQVYQEARRKRKMSRRLYQRL